MQWCKIDVNSSVRVQNLEKWALKGTNSEKCNKEYKNLIYPFKISRATRNGV